MDLPSPSWAPDGTPDQSLERNWLFHLLRRRYRSRATGQAHDYYIVELADAVNVVALTPGRRVILVEQFRAGSGRDSLETPGGLLDPGEDALVAAARELREETGYAGDPPRLLGTVWSNPSILSSRVTTVLITNARPVAMPKLDAGEEVRTVLVRAKEVPELIRTGRIDHALAVQGLMAWMIHELPGQALGDPSPRRRFQLNIASIMIAVVVTAVICFYLKSLLRPGFFAGASGAVVLASGAIVLMVLDPPRRSVLLRPTREALRRRIVRVLAVVGLSVAWYLALLLFYAIFLL